MKILFSRNTLKTKYEQTKLFHLKGMRTVSEMRFAEPAVIHHCRKNQRLNGNSPEIAPAEKHSFRLIYQSETYIIIRKSRVPEINLKRYWVVFRSHFKSELTLIYQTSKYIHNDLLSLKRYE